jgi:hypothetical protein
MLRIGIQSEVSFLKSLALTPRMAWVVEVWNSVPGGQAHVPTSALPQAVSRTGDAAVEAKMARALKRADDLILTGAAVDGMASTKRYLSEITRC